jgi:hypothetical protein
LRHADRSLLLGATGVGPLAIDLALRLTLLDLLLRPVGNWALRPLILGLAAIALLRSRWLGQPLLWLALAGLTGARALLDWPLADNHAYLLAYWCLAASLALMARDADRALAFNGRLLIGLVFLFACIWKFALSGDYLDGTFFQVTLLTDPRFEGFTQIAGGLDARTYDALSEFVGQHRDAAPSVVGGVDVPRRFEAVALAATGWNVFINAALAVAFLWPLGRGPSRLRHVLLLVYCTITYAVATVDGFGWLLLAMGAAQCTVEQRRTRIAYVVVFVLIILYREVPWADRVFLPLLA